MKFQKYSEEKPVDIQYLKSGFPDAYQKAYGNWKVAFDPINSPEGMAMLKSIEKLCELAEAEVDDNDVQPHLGLLALIIRFKDFSVGEFQGPAAAEWLESKVLSQFRDPVSGQLKPHPLTGSHFDEFMIHLVIDRVNEGCTLDDSFDSLGKLAAQELETNLKKADMLAEQRFLEDCHQRRLEFSIDGGCLTD